MKYYEINDGLDCLEPEYFQSHLGEDQVLEFLNILCGLKDTPHWAETTEFTEEDEEEITPDDLPKIDINESGEIGIACYGDTESIKYWARKGVVCV